ncbi:hypothetical protein LWI29_024680 [Acer saccharum]|uniref:Uncharacterized protein n=1 Tax=Acer saccharum TaxID=4024 RepID=A0AA39SKU4_ACESA|nr:hypothetical protein LWI29_024680 [Acer saccharum]
MKEALGLAPKHASKPQGNRLDKHELSELVKRGSTAEDVGAGHAEAAWVHGVGFARLLVSKKFLGFGLLPQGHLRNVWYHVALYYGSSFVALIFLGFYHRAPRPWEDPTTLQSSIEEVLPAVPNPPVEKPEKDESEDESKRKKRNTEKDELEDESSRKKKRREEKRHEKHERCEKRHFGDSDDKRKHRKDKQKRRHDSD